MCGAFVGLDKIVRRRTNKSGIGFNADLPQTQSEIDRENRGESGGGIGGSVGGDWGETRSLGALEKLEVEDLEEFGCEWGGHACEGGGGDCVFGVLLSYHSCV